MNQQSITVAAFGEFDLIDALVLALPDTVRMAPQVAVPIGDDAALIEVPEGESLVVTTDTMVDTVHFRLDWTDWRSLGHKVLAVNLSDLAAMGARPLAVTITLGLTGGERIDDLVDMYRGIGSLADAFGVGVAGGDIVRSPGGLVIECTAMGSVARDRAVMRSGAQPGDAIVVSGTLGASAAGMRFLHSGDTSAMTADLLVAAHLRPTPRLVLGAAMHDAGVTAAMDLSDGLLGDVPKILRASGVGATIESARVPVAAAVRALFADDWRSLAMSGGEDYELLMTIPPERLAAFQTSAADVGATITRIGTVTDRADELLVDGAPAGSTGFDHFG